MFLWACFWEWIRMRLSIAYVRAQVLDNTFSHLLSIVIIFLGLFIPSRKEEKLCPRLVTILQGADCLCVPKVSCWYCSISSSTNSTKQILYRRGKGIQDLKKKKNSCLQKVIPLSLKFTPMSLRHQSPLETVSAGHPASVRQDSKWYLSMGSSQPHCHSQGLFPQPKSMVI